MAESEKDRIARQVGDLRVAFDLALSDKRKYPVREFYAFLRSAAVNGVREFLEAERKRIPGNVLFEADRLECQLFAGCDPSFDGGGAPIFVSVCRD